MMAAAEEAVEEQDISTTISSSSPTARTKHSNKKLVWMALAAVAVIAVIVIPVTITQLNNDVSESKMADTSLADPFIATPSKIPSVQPSVATAATTQSPTLSPITAQPDGALPTIMSPTLNATLAPSNLTNIANTPGMAASTETIPETASPSTAEIRSPTATPTITIDSDTNNPTTLWTPLTEPLLGDAAGTPYLHCPANPNLPSNIEIQHTVLLHGAAFSKEIWVQTGIMQQFCNEPAVSATALDMSFATHTQLQAVLDALVNNNNDKDSTAVVKLPVVLVTPSAGGSGVVDWMINGDVNLLREYVSVWIPVAVGSLSSATDAQVRSIAPLPVLAIYGDGDVSGGRISQRLARLVGATVVELAGGHPVYRDSPNAFVATIFQYLSKSWMDPV